jgi:hypothetical protein
MGTSFQMRKKENVVEPYFLDYLAKSLKTGK